MTDLLPLRAGRYRTKNGRVVRLVCREANRWCGAFAGVMRIYRWRENGKSASRPHDGAWDLVARVEEK